MGVGFTTLGSGYCDRSENLGVGYTRTQTHRRSDPGLNRTVSRFKDSGSDWGRDCGSSLTHSKLPPLPTVKTSDFGKKRMERFHPFQPLLSLWFGPETSGSPLRPRLRPKIGRRRPESGTDLLLENLSLELKVTST